MRPRANINTLHSQRKDLSRHFFRCMLSPTHKLHHLLPPPRLVPHNFRKKTTYADTDIHVITTCQCHSYLPHHLKRQFLFSYSSAVDLTTVFHTLKHYCPAAALQQQLFSWNINSFSPAADEQHIATALHIYCDFKNTFLVSSTTQHHISSYYDFRNRFTYKLCYPNITALHHSPSFLQYHSTPTIQLSSYSPTWQLFRRPASQSLSYLKLNTMVIYLPWLFTYHGYLPTM